MKWALFYHSLLSDWNHGNAHFLRGIVRELRRRGHEVTVYEPRGGWSRRNLIEQQGEAVLHEIEYALELQGCWQFYDPSDFQPESLVEDADVVLVHEWTDRSVIRALADWRQRHPQSTQRLLYHDTHHRAISEPASLPLRELESFDGVLAFGECLRQVYENRGCAAPVWVWHEAADASWFYPRPRPATREDLVWIGNWGDNERTSELQSYLFSPACQLRLKGRVHGVRYPMDALTTLTKCGLRYEGWLPNHHTPEVYARARLTVHVPRDFYTRRLPGIPTIRIFEALACGIPLVSAPWDDTENLFHSGNDFIIARSPTKMREALRAVLADQELADHLANHGRQTITRRHTCAHRVNELELILSTLGVDAGKLFTRARWQAARVTVSSSLAS